MAIKPVIEELNYFPDPVLTFAAFSNDAYSSFLDSGMDENRLGRFSFIGCDPFMVIRCKGEEIKIIEPVPGTGCISASLSQCLAPKTIKDNPFKFLKETLSRYKIVRTRKDLPFNSGCVGFFSYDLRYFIERLPDAAIDDMSMPDFILCFYDIIIIFDNLKKKAYISSSGFPFFEPIENRKRREDRLREYKSKIDSIYNNGSGIYSGAASFITEDDESLFTLDISSNFTKEKYYRAIERAKELIARGDIYQVNLSQRFECDFGGSAFGLYMRLREINPAPFAAYLNFGDFKIVSASPERFIKIEERYIETRPIKGTRPRGSDRSEDIFLGKELLSSPKDRAEHIMIVDLERSDLGRVCEYGSVKPAEFIILESYATVHHLVSTVSGRLRKKTDIVDCLMNCFPGGSITGAPKVRSMEVIEELEPTKRGIYTGSIGYIDFGGNADLSIVIRTIIIKDRKLYFHVGGGIVADSDPEKEYQETLDKARALMDAVGSYKISNNAREAHECR